MVFLYVSDLLYGYDLGSNSVDVYVGYLRKTWVATD